MLELYKNLNLSLTENTKDGIKIVYGNLKQFIIELARRESYFLELESYNKTFVENKTFEESVEVLNVVNDQLITQKNNFNFDKFRAAWYIHVLYPKGNPDLISNFITKYL